MQLLLEGEYHAYKDCIRYSLHFVYYLNLDIGDLGCIGECTSLERLDLSYNAVTKLHKLAGLENLQYLNLSANRITSLG